MNLARFRQIISAFHPEAGESAVSYKCHQLRYTIISVNDTASKTFDLGPTSDFDKVVMVTRSLFCYVRQ